MTTTAETIGATALQTAAALAPQLAAADPKVAAVVALAPLALQLLQTATAAQQAGLLSDAQLAGLFASIGSGIQSTHAQWAALNAADARTAPGALASFDPAKNQQPPFTPAAGYSHGA